MLLQKSLEMLVLIFFEKYFDLCIRKQRYLIHKSPFRAFLDKIPGEVPLKATKFGENITDLIHKTPFFSKKDNGSVNRSAGTEPWPI